MPKPIDNALSEASNPQTEPERLQELSEWELRDERARLRQAISANPNCDETLLLELAAEYPDEVVANPRFQLLLISDEPWWEHAEPLSMLRLLAALGDTAPRHAWLNFLDQIGELITSTGPLEMHMEEHMSFTQEITVEWRDGPLEEDDTESEERDSGEDVGQDPNDLTEQNFSIDFSCVVEENLYLLNPPDKVDDPLDLLEELLKGNRSEDLLRTLMKHSWGEECSSLGDYGYWEIKSVSPVLDDWELHADLSIDGSGSIEITDPAGKTHVVEVEAPDKDYEILNPVLKEYPDLIGSIFKTDALSSAELRRFLQQLIAIEEQSRGSEGNEDAAQ